MSVIPVPQAQAITNIMAYLPSPNTDAAGQIYSNYLASGSELYDADQPDAPID